MKCCLAFCNSEEGPGMQGWSHQILSGQVFHRGIVLTIARVAHHLGACPPPQNLDALRLILRDNLRIQ